MVVRHMCLCLSSNGLCDHRLDFAVLQGVRPIRGVVCQSLARLSVATERTARGARARCALDFIVDDGIVGTHGVRSVNSRSERRRYGTGLIAR